MRYTAFYTGLSQHSRSQSCTMSGRHRFVAPNPRIFSKIMRACRIFHQAVWTSHIRIACRSKPRNCVFAKHRQATPSLPVSNQVKIHPAYRIIFVLIACVAAKIRCKVNPFCIRIQKGGHHDFHVHHGRLLRKCLDQVVDDTFAKCHVGIYMIGRLQEHYVCNISESYSMTACA